jgi:hypothetical protein
MIYTIQDCTDWSKLSLRHVDLPWIIKAVIILCFANEQSPYEIVRRR